MNSEYLINFTIPQGPTGPTGARGETGPIGPTGASDTFRTFGYIGNQNQIDSIFLPNNQAIQMAFPVKLQGLNVSYITDNCIRLLNDGYYIIVFSILLQVPDASLTAPTKINASLRINSSINSFSTTSINVEDNTQHYITNAIIINANQNDLIDVILSADRPADFLYTTAYLYTFKLSNLT